MRSRSWSRAAVALLVVLAAGCARTAPQLPPDDSDLSLDDFERDDVARTCEDIDGELAGNGQEMDRLTAYIQSRRGTNQAAGYIGGVLFLPALLATDDTPDEKRALDEHQARRDTLVSLKRAKGC